ncbi:HAMP domain-containing sensor histidine kinase [Thermosyntropha sp.]|uniref:sensor histidine kinase n=1 Tax=Thermosyntropha sp. TaxID=2740820 RepID=UPI0025E032A9|nr:HAMP domain-containing sensor histidine kinase [Thermosyntropha sp.]
MKDFYIKQKEKLLKDIALDIDSFYTGDLEDIDLKLESLERGRGLSLFILDSHLRPKYATRGGIGHMPMRRELRFLLNAYKTSEDKEIFAIVADPMLKTNFLNIIYALNNGDIMVLSTPLEAIEESAGIANRFFLFSASVSLALGIFLIFLWARRFTHPILEMNYIARQMAKLDFSRRCEVKREDELGQLAESLNSLSDQLNQAILDLKQANEKLKDDIERERRIEEMRKEFIYNVSHEFKTPLALIRGYAEGLKLNVAESEEDKNFYCEVIMEETEKMNKLVRELLDLAQMESGNMELEKERFILSLFVSDILHKYHPLFREKEIKLVVDVPEDLEVCADYMRTEQIITNYINNALNHVDENKIIKINAWERGDKVRISVYNSGQHIPEDDLDKVFMSFYKVDKARTRAYGGTGLGLAVVKAIQELDGNLYGVDNVEGGVSFWFELDLA